MGIAAVATGLIQCSCGTAPMPLMVADARVLGENKPSANIMDNEPMVNIMPFGTCSAIPTAPKPCVPMTKTAPWIPGEKPTTFVRGQPALDNTCKLICTMGGLIQFVNPGTTKTMV